MEKKRYHIIIASIIFAILIWITVNLRDEYTVVMHVPVVLNNLKEGKALKYSIPKNVSMRFKGSGWQLAGLHIFQDLKYYIDLSLLRDEDYVITGRDWMEHIKLPFSLQPIEIKPDTIILAVDNYKGKRVPILINVMITYKDGYGQVGQPNISPESLLISGSKNLLESVSYWPTTFRKLADLNVPVNIDIPLEEPANYSIDLHTKRVLLQIDVQPFAEKTFTRVPITTVGTPQNQEVVFIPPRMDIIVRGGIQQLSKLTQEDFHASVSFQSLSKDTIESIVPDVTVYSDVKIISKMPNRFKYIIRKRL